MPQNKCDSCASGKPKPDKRSDREQEASAPTHKKSEEMIARRVVVTLLLLVSAELDPMRDRQRCTACLERPFYPLAVRAENTMGNEHVATRSTQTQALKPQCAIRYHNRLNRLIHDAPLHHPKSR
jgi:hypothetical protein